MAGVLFALAAGAGCAFEWQADLIRVDEVSPSRVEPGTRLYVTGDGFPVGRPARIELAGELRSPGAPPRRVRAEAVGRAVSSDTVVVPVRADLVATLGGRGTFEGDVEISFESADRTGRVAGRLEGATLDFTPAARARLDDEIDRTRRALALLDRVGIAIGDGEPAAGGLSVDGTEPGSAAAAVGIAKGDRIVAIEGLRVDGIADFLPPPGTSVARVAIERPGEAAEITVRLAIDEGDSGAVARHAAIVLLALVAIVLAFLAPTARFAASIASWRAPARASDGMRWLLGASPPAGGRASRVRAILFVTGAALAVSLAFAAMPWTARVFAGGVDAGILLLVALASRLSASFASAVWPFETTPARARARAVLAALGRFAMGGIPAAAAVLCTGVFAGTLRVQGVVLAQGGWPWEWLALRNPIVFALSPAFVVIALGGAPAGAAAGRADPIREVAERAYLLAMSAFAVVLFLGGWRLPGVAGDPLERSLEIAAAATALFVAKAWLVLAFATRVRGAAGGAARLWTLAIPIACGALAIAWAATGASRDFEATAAPVLCALALAFVLRHLMRRERAARERMLHPFL